MSWAVDSSFMVPSLSPFPSSFTHSSSSNAQNDEWSIFENKVFETGLAMYGEEMPNRWEMIAAQLPAKNAQQVKERYKSLVSDLKIIDSGKIPLPPYRDEKGEADCSKGGTREKTEARERKKGVPWSEEEHRLFLLGLNKFGKGDWRNISRNFVISRTPTQVASHAQKFFYRMSTGNRGRRRASIHDIRNVNDPYPMKGRINKHVSLSMTTQANMRGMEYFAPNVGPRLPSSNYSSMVGGKTSLAPHPSHIYGYNVGMGNNLLNNFMGLAGSYTPTTMRGGYQGFVASSAMGGPSYSTTYFQHQ